MKEEPPVKIHTDKSGTAIGLLEAEKRFRRIKSYQEILLLKERLKSVAHSAEGCQDTRSRLNLVRGKGLQCRTSRVAAII